MQRRNIIELRLGSACMQHSLGERTGTNSPAQPPGEPRGCTPQDAKAQQRKGEASAACVLRPPALGSAQRVDGCAQRPGRLHLLPVVLHLLDQLDLRGQEVGRVLG